MLFCFPEIIPADVVWFGSTRDGNLTIVDLKLTHGDTPIAEDTLEISS